MTFRRFPIIPSQRDSAKTQCAVQHVFAQVLSGAEVVSEKRVLHKSEGVARAWSKTLGMGPSHRQIDR